MRMSLIPFPSSLTDFLPDREVIHNPVVRRFAFRNPRGGGFLRAPNLTRAVTRIQNIVAAGSGPVEWMPIRR